MLAELILLNSAFGVIKETVTNGKDLLDAGASLGQFFGAERAVKKKLEAGKLSVEDAFAAKRDLEKAEVELKYILNKERIGGYMIWLEFKTEYYRDQRASEKLELRKRRKRANALQANLAIGIKAGLIILIIMGALFGVALHFYER